MVVNDSCITNARIEEMIRHSAVSEVLLDPQLSSQESPFRNYISWRGIVQYGLILSFEDSPWS